MGETAAAVVGAYLLGKRAAACKGCQNAQNNPFHNFKIRLQIYIFYTK